ncbi:ABC transporter substrate-binding protein [Roseofilum casamattae]|uniref:ABC transporter substrate-binding protein n=1 Tax=Roseofilum casamattae BLCC-M143 TaxID=3022442 RepID=A0ABT7BWB4_9CYAN|nr:ABC transporter substrate-binding protein [Roseofilum casamattae]MDJ1183497.1 ABC transporter substrate-binding protein [Roseofilum casamattae BLCC-M143]
MNINQRFLVVMLLGCGIILSSCTPRSQELIQERQQSDRQSELSSTETGEQSLTIWWEQGYTPGENEVVRTLVKEWEKQSGIKTKLELRPGSIDAQVINAIERGNSPDIAGPIFLTLVDLAWEGKLTDVSDVIAPMQDKFNLGTLKTANLIDRTKNSRSFYGIPMGIFTYNIHYWQPYLDRLGLQQSNIPQEWDEFWLFWEEVRDRLHEAGETNITSFCLPLSGDSSDGYDMFLLFLQGHNTKILDKNDRFVLDRPQNRQGLINTLSQLSRLYQEGLTPPDVFSWQNPDNNTQFLNRTCLLTINATLSIPTTQKLPITPYTQKENQRYTQEIVTLSRWPETANGTAFNTSIGSYVIVIPSNARNTKAAKEFLAYLFEPENLQQWTEEVGGRFLPVMPELLQTPFWQDVQDPHLSAIQILSETNTQPYLPFTHPAIGKIREGQIFVEALKATINGDRSVEEIADEAIARVQDIVAPYVELNPVTAEEN